MKSKQIIKWDEHTGKILDIKSGEVRMLGVRTKSSDESEGDSKISKSELKRKSELELLAKDKQISGLEHQIQLILLNANGIFLKYKIDFLYKTNIPMQFAVSKTKNMMVGSGSVIFEENKDGLHTRKVVALFNNHQNAVRLLRVVAALFPEIKIVITYNNKKDNDKIIQCY